MSTIEQAEGAAQHTPGPWHVIRHNPPGGETWLAIGWTDAEGRKIGPLTELVGDYLSENAPSWSPVARMKYLCASDEQQIANARLIAAAPETAAERDRLREVNRDLLEALKAVQWSYSVFAGARVCALCAATKDEGHSPECPVGAAIAKAEG